jgi:hypothetical protein
MEDIRNARRCDEGRELYAKALAGGIQEAKDRSVALH